MTLPTKIEAYDEVAHAFAVARDLGGLKVQCASPRKAEQWRNRAYRYRRMTGKHHEMILTLAYDQVIIRPRPGVKLTDMQGRDVRACVHD